MALKPSGVDHKESPRQKAENGAAGSKRRFYFIYRSAYCQIGSPIASFMPVFVGRSVPNPSHSSSSFPDGRSGRSASWRFENTIFGVIISTLIGYPSGAEDNRLEVGTRGQHVHQCMER